jgi:arylsulfatase A-like enzyme
MMKKILLYLSILFFFSFQKPADTPKPNFIFILADDLGYGDVGCFGSKIIKTPHLDRLATEGVRLSQFYSGNTVCAPSRCALMTGKHMGNAYIRGNGEIPLRPRDTILPEILKKAGYNTALFGKWGLGDVNTEGSPERKGWDSFFGFLHHVEGHFQMPGVAWLSTPEAPTPTRLGSRSSGYAGDMFTENAVAWLKKQNATKPFFMELALTIPHAELYAQKEAMKRYQDTNGNSIFEEKPFEGSHYGGQNQPKAAYAAMVSKVDDYVGKIVETLKAQGLDKNTIIVFSSDNGTHIEGGRTMEDVKLMQSSGILRGVKRDLYEGGIRVPSIAWGGDLPKGVIREGQGAFWDILPTFLDMAHIKNPLTVDGISLYNHWKTGEKLPSRPLYWEFSEGGFFQAVRLDDWKFIILNKKEGEKIELYDLKSDISETKNLAAEKPQQVELMKHLIAKLHTKSELPLFRKADEK